MEDLLLLVHRIPYPPNKGDKIRSYHLLKHLAQSYRVHLATFIDDDNDWQYVDKVKELCAETHIAGLNPLTAKLRSLSALLAGRPLSLDYYRNAAMQVVERHKLTWPPILDEEFPPSHTSNPGTGIKYEKVSIECVSFYISKIFVYQ